MEAWCATGGRPQGSVITHQRIQQGILGDSMVVFCENQMSFKEMGIVFFCVVWTRRGGGVPCALEPIPGTLGGSVLGGSQPQPTQQIVPGKWPFSGLGGFGAGVCATVLPIPKPDLTPPTSCLCPQSQD